MPRTLTAWRPEEDQILRDNYFDCTREELCRMLPGRVWGGIKNRASKLKIKRDLSLVQKRAVNGHRTEARLSSERVVLQFVIDYHQQQSVSPMRQQISEGTGICRKTVEGAVRRLVDRGLLVVPNDGVIRPVGVSPALQKKLLQRELAYRDRVKASA